MSRRNPLTRLDDAVIDRVAQPVVDRFSDVPLREQVRFCVAGAIVASCAKVAWLHRAGDLGAGEVVWQAVLLMGLAFNYANAWGVPAGSTARNPNRIDPVLRAMRLLMLALTALQASVFVALSALAGWDTWGALLMAWNAVYTAAVYVSACDEPPPPTPKAVPAPAGV